MVSTWMGDHLGTPCAVGIYLFPISKKIFLSIIFKTKAVRVIYTLTHTLQCVTLTALHSPTPIPLSKHRFSSDHRTKATFRVVITSIVERLGTPCAVGIQILSPSITTTYVYYLTPKNFKISLPSHPIFSTFFKTMAVNLLTLGRLNTICETNHISVSNISRTFIKKNIHFL